MKWVELTGRNFPEPGQYVIKTASSHPYLSSTHVLGYIELTKTYDKKKKKWIYNWHVNNQKVTHYLDESN